MDIEIGKSYRIYGKLEGMRRFKPLGGNALVDKLIYAEIFYVNEPEHIVKLKKELAFLSEQGEFELREVKNNG